MDKKVVVVLLFNYCRNIYLICFKYIESELHEKIVQLKLPSSDGKKYLVIGNHDWRNLTPGVCQRFEEVSQQMNIKIEGKHIWLNHFPYLCFSGAWRGLDASWQLFGHVHTSPYADSGLDHQRLVNLFTTQFDVGTDNNNFTPISFNEML